MSGHNKILKQIETLNSQVMLKNCGGCATRVQTPGSNITQHVKYGMVEADWNAWTDHCTNGSQYCCYKSFGECAVV